MKSKPLSSGLCVLSSCLLAVHAFPGVSQGALVAHWEMNEAAGSLEDSSGNAITANLVGAGIVYSQNSVTQGTYGNLSVSASQAAEFGSSLYLNGNSNFSGSSPLISTLAQTGTPGVGVFTVMAWINPDSIPTVLGVTERIFSVGQAWTLGLRENGSLVLTTPGVIDKITSGAAVTAGSWNHVAVTWENGAAALYINGILTSHSDASNLGIIATDSLNFQIGRNETWGQYFDGYMDEMKVFNSALTADQILFAATAIPEPSVSMLGLMGVCGVMLRRRCR